MVFVCVFAGFAHQLNVEPRIHLALHLTHLDAACIGQVFLLMPWHTNFPVQHITCGKFGVPSLEPLATTGTRTDGRLPPSRSSMDRLTEDVLYQLEVYLAPNLLQSWADLCNIVPPVGCSCCECVCLSAQLNKSQNA